MHTHAIVFQDLYLKSGKLMPINEPRKLCLLHNEYALPANQDALFQTHRESYLPSRYHPSFLLLTYAIQYLEEKIYSIVSQTTYGEIRSVNSSTLPPFANNFSSTASFVNSINFISGSFSKLQATAMFLAVPTLSPVIIQM